jgi:Secretion system C-terminal sorting domain
LLYQNHWVTSINLKTIKKYKQLKIKTMKTMKTFYALLVVMCVSVAATAATAVAPTSKVTALNDSTISFDLVNNVKTAKHIYSYNQYGKKTMDQAFTWDNVNSIWVPSLTTTLTYNSLNQNTLTLKSKYTVSTNSWAASTKSTSAFDMNGKDVMDEDSVINTSTGLYKPNYHTVNTYDVQGNKTSIRNKWNTTTVTWTIPYDQTTTTSDSIMLTDSAGVSRKFYKTLYNTTTLYDVPSSSFLNSTRNDFVYQLIANKKPYIAEGSKIEQIASTYIAGVAGAAGTWAPASKQDFVGDSISGKSYVNKYTCSGGVYSYTSQDTRYFTPTTVQILNITAVDNVAAIELSLSPNPVKDLLKVSGLVESAKITIFNLTGKALITRTIANNESISLGTLSSGVYIAKVMNLQGELVYKTKLIKQ